MPTTSPLQMPPPWKKQLTKVTILGSLFNFYKISFYWSRRPQKPVPQNRKHEPQFKANKWTTMVLDTNVSGNLSQYFEDQICFCWYSVTKLHKEGSTLFLFFSEVWLCSMWGFSGMHYIVLQKYCLYSNLMIHLNTVSNNKTDYIFFIIIIAYIYNNIYIYII